MFDVDEKHVVFAPPPRRSDNEVRTIVNKFFTCRFLVYTEDFVLTR